jgi:FeS assembly protein IscX
MTDRELDWDSGYEIVLELIERYPDIDIAEVSLDDLCKRITALPGFVGDAAWVNDKILRDILREWYEEIGD